MNDADLLDLLEILQAILSRDIDRADRMISSFRTAIRQRMAEKAGEV